VPPKLRIFHSFGHVSLQFSELTYYPV